MTDDNDVRKVDKYSRKIAMGNVEDLYEKIRMGQNTVAISASADILGSFQNTVNNLNISGIISALNALSASRLINIASLTLPLASLSSSIQIDPNAINATSEVLASYNKVWSSAYMQAIQNISESTKNMILKSV